MATLSVSYSFSPTTTIESGQVNQNFTDIVNFVNNTASPIGIVVGWKGAIVDIPTGWTLDNDLKDRMIIGAGNLYNYGATGGASTVTLSTGNLPAHGHTFSGTTGGQNATHYHGVGPVAWGTGAGGTNRRYETGSGGLIGTEPYNGNTGNASGDHGHPFSGTTDNTGSGTPFNILPPYYAMAFIRRT